MGRLAHAAWEQKPLGNDERQRCNAGVAATLAVALWLHYRVICTFELRVEFDLFVMTPPVTLSSSNREMERPAIVGAGTDEKRPPAVK